MTERADGARSGAAVAPGSQQAEPNAVEELVARGWAAPAAPGASADEAPQRAEALQAVHRELQLEEQRVAAELQCQAECQQELLHQLDEACAAAGQQHEAIGASLAALAAHLNCLSVGGATAGSSSAQHPSWPLLSVGVPDSYARACSALLDGLAGYVQHHFPNSGDGEAAAAHRHQLQCRELEQLQSCVCKGEWLRVEEEAELARLQAELEVLQAPAASAAASLGYSTSDLEAEVASLVRKRDASLPQAQAAAEAAAATAAGAEALEEQCQQRQAMLMQRVEVKHQVLNMLTRHLARQLLVSQLLQHEQAMLQQMQAAAAAAQEDAESVVQAALERLPGYQEQAQQAPHQRQPGATSGDTGSAPAATACAAELSAASGQGSDPDMLPMAEQLLTCRAELQQLAEQVHVSILPAQHAVVAQLAGVLYGSKDGTSAAGLPQLSPPQLLEQVREVAAAHDALTLQANAVLDEVIRRTQAQEERQLAEHVLLHFWGDAKQLTALAAKNQHRLERFA